MYKKLLFLLFFLSINLFGQSERDSIPAKLDSIKIPENDFFSDVDLAIIDSLVLESKYNSPLYDTVSYYIKDADKKKVSDVTLTANLLKERLKTIDAKTPFHIAYNPALEKVIKSYLKYRKKYYPNLMAKAAYYFPMFEKYLDQYDIPLEMKYLAIVESALNPKARSRVGATGLWQFMYQTGKQYKLKVSSYVDERQDPIKSTIAACEYLSDLYRIFGDWDLALAAYNSGPGNVSKAIKRSGGYKNYWNIRPFLPRETAGYVPAFYATMYLFEYSEEHDLVSNAPKIHHFATDTLTIKRTVSFDQISEKIGVDAELLAFLNPAYKLDIIPYIKGRDYKLILPKAATGGFLKTEKELYALADQDDAKREKPLPKYFEMDQRIRYRVRNGDYLGKIANRYGVRVSDIKKWNRLRNNRLRIGQRLTIYPKRLRIPKQKTSSIKSKNNQPKGEYTIYTVKKGDSLWTIAKKFPKVSTEDIKKWNNIWSAKSIKPGTKLKIYKS
ncbi:LysM peptidoglycan-binding domain-containing protein [Pseudotenacibaculum sp. MALMAid0570]|uniref:lytic transglycosylase domain-containing protein n=1 Tax=Pseudotenacibaculum sp. MALMAid0570 TaxID=3143938 RepID=UPI0032DE3C8D